tara:strand:- start:6089 stop:6922 length:834 start_codon:yes stop_codon:yes gene_type:complete
MASTEAKKNKNGSVKSHAMYDEIVSDKEHVSNEEAGEREAKADEPEVSVVIPVYNEVGIITSSVEDLVAALRDMEWSFELILSENGSSDATFELAKNLEARFEEVRAVTTGEPNYGKALRLGIMMARGKFVLCDEIDLCDTRFYRNAMAILRQDSADMVVGSKLLAGANDSRGWFRNSASKVLNNMLHHLVGFQGTDTHGLKAFRRDRLLRVVESCLVDKDLFTSELVIRAERLVRVTEIPLEVIEKRRPSINLVRRVPNVLKNMGRLVWIFRIRGE